MPPKDKITANRAASKDYCDRPLCIYCGFPFCWKHGTYCRKWFYLFGSEPPSEPELVQRYICREPSCERTFSVLPENVLPYCHFHLGGLLSIVRDLAEGKSRYRIAKTGWGISLRVLLRAVLLIQKVTPLLESLCREVVGSVAPCFQTLVTTIRENLFWRDFTRRWFHGLYPCRAGNIFNPHNQGIKRM